eukprot:TRINITY_DN11120_c0_g1_i1.p1 TRINITY_DN11120_c0_g1~~TRINITY_DN11120_c0_g1_i1.p1  ORF type:complete len:205 (-),score=55.79 TRINITY_DN11120_c0_g1_i1:33-647(-)
MYLQRSVQLTCLRILSRPSYQTVFARSLATSNNLNVDKKLQQLKEKYEAATKKSKETIDDLKQKAKTKESESKKIITDLKNKIKESSKTAKKDIKAGLKRPKTGWANFLKEKLDNTKDMAIQMKDLGSLWKTLDAKEKAKFLIRGEEVPGVVKRTSAYANFTKDYYSKRSDELKEKPFSERAKIIGEEWKKLSESEKKAYLQHE